MPEGYFGSVHQVIDRMLEEISICLRSVTVVLLQGDAGPWMDSFEPTKIDLVPNRDKSADTRTPPGTSASPPRASRSAQAGSGAGQQRQGLREPCRWQPPGFVLCKLHVGFNDR